jgi:hypothetical protein
MIYQSVFKKAELVHRFVNALRLTGIGEAR